MAEVYHKCLRQPASLFGRSDKPDARYIVAWCAAVLGDLLDTLRVDRAVLVGHSLGAIICHWLALGQPGCVEWGATPTTRFGSSQSRLTRSARGGVSPPLALRVRFVKY